MGEMMERQLSDTAGRCDIWAKLFPTQEDLSRHLADEHSIDNLGNMLT